MSRRRLSAAGLVGLDEAANGPAPSRAQADNQGGFPRLAEMPAPAVADTSGVELPRGNSDGAVVVGLPLVSIRPSTQQPRRTFDPKALQTLATSIASHGEVLQPILVRRIEDEDEAASFEIVAGERRWQAAAMVGHPTIRAIIEGADDATSARMALIENMAREDLNAIEEARGCVALHERHGVPYSTIAKQVGRSPSAISHLTRLLDLPSSVIEHIEAGRLRAGHGGEILRLNDDEDRRALAELCVAKGWSVRELERQLDAQLKVSDATEAARRSPPDADEMETLTGLTERLVPLFGTRPVTIAPQRKGQYEIRVRCASIDELKATVNHLNHTTTEGG